MFMFTSERRMRKQLDEITKTVNETNTSVKLILQDHGNTKERVSVAEEKVGRIEARQLEHHNTIEKLEKYSASNHRELEELKQNQQKFSEKQKQREPFWNALSVIWSRTLYVSAGVMAAAALKWMGVV